MLGVDASYARRYTNQPIRRERKNERANDEEKNRRIQGFLSGVVRLCRISV